MIAKWLCPAVNMLQLKIAKWLCPAVNMLQLQIAKWLCPAVNMLQLMFHRNIYVVFYSNNKRVLEWITID